MYFIIFEIKDFPTFLSKPFEVPRRFHLFQFCEQLDGAASKTEQRLSGRKITELGAEREAITTS